MKIDTLIFDMDGVITTEEKYWACVRLTLWELITTTLGLNNAFGDAVNDEGIRESVVPDELIYALKGRAVNSNWDITYIVTCTYLAAVPGATVLSAPDIESFLEALHDTVEEPAPWPQALQHFLAHTGGAKGRALVQEAGHRLCVALEFNQEDLLRADGPMWWYLHDRFQRFYSGEAMQAYSAAPLTDGTVIAHERIAAALKRLHDSGYTLGVASGRPRNELDDALGHLGLLDYFAPNHLGTFDVVHQAETKLGVVGLAKPHPLSLMRALYPDESLERLLNEDFQKQKRPNVVVIGDATSDVIMAKSAGCRSVGVLTGVRGPEARQERHILLEHAGVEAILDDITEVPDWLEGQID